MSNTQFRAFGGEMNKANFNPTSRSISNNTNNSPYRKILFHSATSPTTMYNNGILNEKVQLSKSRDHNANSTSNLNDFKYPDINDRLYPRINVYNYLGWGKIYQTGCGYYNMGSTCYLNSALQCMTHTPALYQLILQDNHGLCQKDKRCMICSFQRHLRLAMNSNQPISPQEIVSNLKFIGKQFRFLRQEDSHEFLICFLDCLHKRYLELNHLDQYSVNSLSETTLIHQIFGGFSINTVRCNMCKYESNSYEPFLSLLLSVPYNVHTLAESLSLYHNKEVLSSTCGYKCNRCRSSKSIDKSNNLFIPPYNLIIQLKRFDSRGRKITTKIMYPEELDLKPYLSPATTRLINDTHLIYQLYGVIVHDGFSVNSGHYYSYVKGGNNFWYQFDDHRKEISKIDKVLNKNVYILFYSIKSPSLLSTLIPIEQESIPPPTDYQNSNNILCSMQSISSVSSTEIRSLHNDNHNTELTKSQQNNDSGSDDIKNNNNQLKDYSNTIIKNNKITMFDSTESSNNDSDFNNEIQSSSDDSEYDGSCNGNESDSSSPQVSVKSDESYLNYLKEINRYKLTIGSLNNSLDYLLSLVNTRYFLRGKQKKFSERQIPRIIKQINLVKHLYHQFTSTNKYSQESIDDTDSEFDFNGIESDESVEFDMDDIDDEYEEDECINQPSNEAIDTNHVEAKTKVTNITDLSNTKYGVHDVDNWDDTNTANSHLKERYLRSDVRKREETRNNRKQDEWNEYLDTGKLPKVKTIKEKRKYNPFQKIQEAQFKKQKF